MHQSRDELFRYELLFEGCKCVFLMLLKVPLWIGTYIVFIVSGYYFHRRKLHKYIRFGRLKFLFSSFTKNSGLSFRAFQVNAACLTSMRLFSTGNKHKNTQVGLFCCAVVINTAEGLNKSEQTWRHKVSCLKSVSSKTLTVWKILTVRENLTM